MARSTLCTRLLPAMALGAFLILGCDGDPMAPAAPVASRITILGGDLQVAAAGSRLVVPLSVRVTDRNGRPVSDVRIRWDVWPVAGFEERERGSVNAETTPSLTDAYGVARVHRVLAPVAGDQITTAKIDGTAIPAVRFTSIGQIQGATEIAVRGGGEDTGDTVLTTLSTPHRVIVRDHSGLPVRDVEVKWSVSGGGSLSSTLTRTDASGVAEVIRTLGALAGPQIVEAAVDGLVGSPARFERIAHPGNPVAIAVIGGAGQVGATDSLVSPYHVEVTDAHGNAVSGVVIDWTVTAGAGVIDPVRSITTGPRPFATATHTLGPDEGDHSVAARANGLPGAPGVSFTTTAVTALVRLKIDDSDYWGCYYYYVCTWLFVPASVVIPVGKTVAWLWLGEPCDVVFEDDPTQPTSSPKQETGTHTRTFQEGGTFRYRCTTRSTNYGEGMVGSVTVQ